MFVGGEAKYVKDVWEMRNVTSRTLDHFLIEGNDMYIFNPDPL